MPALERRSGPVEVRTPPEEQRLEQDGLPRRFWARVVNYDVLDDYKTLFREGCFDKGLQNRMPRLMYGHGGWENPHALIGRGIEARSVRGKNGGVDVLFELDDFDHVPTARQVAYQMSNDPEHPTLDRFSVGFVRLKDSRAPSRGGTYIEEALMHEVSVLPEGSVPGTRLLAFRAPSAEVAEDGPDVIALDDAVRIIQRFSLGEIDLVGALQALAEESSASLTDEELNDGDSGDGDPAGDGDTAGVAGEGAAGPAEPAAGQPQGEGAGAEKGEPGAASESYEVYVDEEVDDILAELDEIVGARVPSAVEGRANPLSTKARAKLSASDFVFPDERAFPVQKESAVMDAVNSWGRYKGKHSFDDFKRRLTAICKKNGWAMPASWQKEQASK